MKTDLPLSDLTLYNSELTSRGRRVESPELLDAWARQLAGLLSQPATAPVSPSPTLAPTATEPRGAAGPAQPFQTNLPGGSAPQISDAVSDNRLTLTVNAAALGDICVIIDRTNEGVRVVLGVSAQSAEGALMPEKAALLRALTAVGLNVHSVNVVRQTGLGTDLAQGNLGKIGSAHEEAQSALREDPKLNKKAKRVNFVG